jgi:hypothetical protein
MNTKKMKNLWIGFHNIFIVSIDNNYFHITAITKAFFSFDIYVCCR